MPEGQIDEIDVFEKKKTKMGYGSQGKTKERKVKHKKTIQNDYHAEYGNTKSTWSAKLFKGTRKWDPGVGIQAGQLHAAEGGMEWNTYRWILLMHT